MNAALAATPESVDWNKLNQRGNLLNGPEIQSGAGKSPLHVANLQLFFDLHKLIFTLFENNLHKLNNISLFNKKY